MMQLVCNGVALDLPEGAGLQFTQENPLFAFDNLKCERTTQFKLPATATNDRVLSVARVPAYSGEGMRRKFAAQLQAGAIVKDGLLYVTAWNGKEYDAVFVTGEMIGLQAIKDAGKIADFFAPEDTVVYSPENIKDANTADGRVDFAITRYFSNMQNLLPSMKLTGLISRAYNVITGNVLNIQGQWRILSKQVQGIIETQAQYVFAGNGAVPTTNPDAPIANTVSIEDISEIIGLNLRTILIKDVGGINKYLRIYQLLPKQDITITFPENFPTNLFLISVEEKDGYEDSDPFTSTYSEGWFLGGWFFRHIVTPPYADMPTEGTPLRGQTITIPRGTPFCILDSKKYKYLTDGTDGFIYLSDMQLEFNICVQNEEIHVGDTLRMRDMLPDITLTELFKIYAYLTSTVLNYTDADGVTFDVLDFDTWERVDITQKKMTEDEVRRVFADYAQRNIIEFDSAEEVLSNTRVNAEYTIDNDNLDELKTLATIPFNEGRVISGKLAVFNSPDGADGKEIEKEGIMIAGSSIWGERVTLTPNARLQDLCDTSTQIIVTARMTAEEYEAITAKTLILCDGTLYVWTSRQWQNNAAKFTLARIK